MAKGPNRKAAFYSENHIAGETQRRDAQVSYKRTYAVCRAITGMTIKRAQEYLENVLEQKEIVPAFKFRNGAGHHRQAKVFHVATGRWPTKAVKFVSQLVHELEQNINKGRGSENVAVDPSQIKIKAFDCGLSGRMRHRRNYRAHGRVSQFNNEPCNVRLYGAKVEDIEEAKEIQ